MADVGAIRDALKARISAVAPELTGYDTVPDQVIVPAFIVMPAPGAFLAEVTVDGVEDLSLVVLVLVKKVLAAGSQDALDAYLSAGAANIADAIDSGNTADWDYAVSAPVRNYGDFVWGQGDQEQRYLGFEIPVTVGVS